MVAVMNDVLQMFCRAPECAKLALQVLKNLAEQRLSSKMDFLASHFNNPVKRSDLGMPVGILNIGNSCYLNSTIQSLFAFRPMMKQLHDLYRHLHGKGIEQKTLRALLELHVKYIHYQGLFTISSEHLRNDVKKFIQVCGSYKSKGHFLSGSQQDAVELCDLILENIEEEYTILKLPGQNLVKNLFQIETALQFQCIKCGHCKMMPSITMNTLRLNIPEEYGERDLDLQMIVQEEFDRKENIEHKCDQLNCTSNEKISTTQVQKLPANIVLQLGRYSDEGRKKKNSVFPALVLRIPAPQVIVLRHVSNNQARRASELSLSSLALTLPKSPTQSFDTSEFPNYLNSPPLKSLNTCSKSKLLKNSESLETIRPTSPIAIPSSSKWEYPKPSDSGILSNKKCSMPSDESDGITNLFLMEDEDDDAIIPIYHNDEMDMYNEPLTKSNKIERYTDDYHRKMNEVEPAVTRILQASGEIELYRVTERPERRGSNSSLSSKALTLPQSPTESLGSPISTSLEPKPPLCIKPESPLRLKSPNRNNISYSSDSSNSSNSSDSSMSDTRQELLTAQNREMYEKQYPSTDGNESEDEELSKYFESIAQISSEPGKSESNIWTKQTEKSYPDDEIETAKRLSQESYEKEQKDKIAASPADNRPKVDYVLNAIICHRGMSLSGGHYIAYVLSANGNWYKCDDEDIGEVKWYDLKDEPRLTSTSYCFFYSKKLV